VRLRHVCVPLLALWAAAALINLYATVVAAALGWPIAAVPAAFLAASAGAVAWWRRVPPCGRAARAAYRELEAAIEAAPPAPVRSGDRDLLAQPSRGLPRLHRWQLAEHPDAAMMLTETYTLMWLPPLVLRHLDATWVDGDAPAAGELSPRGLARFTWHTLRTGQGFAGVEEMQALAAELRTATASIQPEKRGRP
jgi:hypothetical protein